MNIILCFKNWYGNYEILHEPTIYNQTTVPVKGNTVNSAGFIGTVEAIEYNYNLSPTEVRVIIRITKKPSIF